MTLFNWLQFKYIQIRFFRKYLGTSVIWTFREIFNDNLLVMTLKGKKLYFNDIQGIRTFMIVYKGLRYLQ
jgi:hypothetical protein